MRPFLIFLVVFVVGMQSNSSFAQQCPWTCDASFQMNFSSGTKPPGTIFDVHPLAPPTDGTGVIFPPFGCLTCTPCEARFTFSYYAPGLCFSYDCCANMRQVPGIGGSLIGKLNAICDAYDTIFFEMGTCNPLYTGNPCPPCVVDSTVYAEEWGLFCGDCN